MDIVVWLRSLGLGKYEAAFRENEIDERVLPNLTQEDLKEIGVGPVGHRRLLLEAIAALRADAGAKAPPADMGTQRSERPRQSERTEGAILTFAQPANGQQTHQAVGERRYLTVLFSDLVASTTISARLDAT